MRWKSGRSRTGGSAAPVDVETARAVRIRVLHVLPAPNGTTQYVDHMIGGAPPEIEILTFSWFRAIFGTYDVLHVHWPEFLVRQRTPVGRFVKVALASTLLLRLELTETPVVRTAHNIAPHESGDRLERSFLEALDRRTVLWIRLNPTTPLPPGVRDATIPHGHYRSVFPPDPATRPEPGRLFQFGLVRRYKGIERLLDVFRAVNDPAMRLTIVGKSQDAALAEHITAVAAADDRIEARLEFVPDDVLAREVRRAELVVLPYREMHNSGAALLALSLDRPVLVPRSAATDGLAREVGEGWVIMYDGVLQPADLLRAMAVARLTRERGTRPHLDERDWELVGRRHAEAYRRVVPHRAGRRR
ncbi:glycosyltransferase [Promicromonospora iranensis]|uniref:Beta-1,4-mannosyltransferase n=1 Tax=Promicromonospora iranensis TaxID=1105144 RepID=A0ABU2CR41_9MICO|nr:glycosyl transferase [Promicromonospora iranensis]MDR7383812.1 beta-1,4-mannosyltransferase [Promicromonospora iranensis]